MLLTHNPWFDIIRVTFEKAASPHMLPLGWVNRDRLMPNLLDEDWTNERRGRSLTNHLSWPFIPSKINLPSMCPYYYIDVNLLWPIKALSPEDGNQGWCFVFHLNSKQWLMRVAFVVFFKLFEGTSELDKRSLDCWGKSKAQTNLISLHREPQISEKTWDLKYNTKYWSIRIKAYCLLRWV